MDVIAVIGQKGGTGKTTLALSLAVAAIEDGLSVAVLDLDPQATAANWADRRADKTLAVLSAPPGRLQPAIEAARTQGADLVIVDTPGKLEGAATAALQAADLCLIPCRPQIYDIETMASTKLLVDGTGRKPPLVILNAVPVAGKRHEEARELIQSMGLPVCPFVLSQRAAFGDAPNGGQTVTEYDPEGKAAEEVRKVYKFISKLVKELRRDPNAQARPAQRLGT